jgi:hypothetical protein
VVSCGLRAREGELGAGAQSRRAHAMSRIPVGGEKGVVCVYAYMQWLCVVFASRAGRGVACGEVWESDGEWMWSKSKGGVLVSSGWRCCLALLSLSPRTLLLAEMGLDQASNTAHAWHARMDEAKLCRDCLSDEHIGMGLATSCTLSFHVVTCFTLRLSATSNLLSPFPYSDKVTAS